MNKNKIQARGTWLAQVEELMTLVDVWVMSLICSVSILGWFTPP